ncbi:hypothetical protein [Dyella ginsengisoli]|uniref:hypothetical protein n=1 Tax=Dyella ginsengisoli TaxID=363848 RepID=UPI0012FE0725|nr:hypothetical protein [Dyella ginsengisoli]
MLSWLRSAGDKARLDQELQRLGAAPTSLPSKMREDLVAVVQAEIDSYRAEVPPTSVFQAFFDDAFRLAAEIPLIIVAEKKLAISSIGDEEYEYLIETIRGGDVGRRDRMVRAIYTACIKWVQHQHPEFTREISK